MNAIERVLDALCRNEEYYYPGAVGTRVGVTRDEFEAALAEAYARGFDDGADVLGALARIEKHGQASNPWRKS